jgi:outer membrane protein OmpA-like peptidoglycan-associated protein
MDAEFVDVHGTGVAGLLTREQGKFLFRERLAADRYGEPQRLQLGASASAEHDPHRQRFVDLDGDGRPALVELGPGSGEQWERDPVGESWAAGKPLPAVPPVAAVDEDTGLPRVYMADLDGDGRTDALVAPEPGGPYTWWRYDGPEAGWVEQREEFEHASEDDGPSPVLGDPDLAVFLADMTGDGLPDVLCLRPNEVAYWPCLGRGKFGAKVVLAAPTIADTIDPRRVRLLDVDGLGCTDILYMGDESATLYVNECGNRLVEGPSLALGDVEQLELSSLTRLDGRMTGSFAFAKAGKDEPIQIVDFFDHGLRPWLLTDDRNGMGLETAVTYASSTKFFLADRDAGIGWKTRLPYCVPVVEAVEVHDRVAGVRTRSRYRYRHGCWDGRERQFRGFGFVEQTDDESFEHDAKDSGFQTFAPEHRTPPIETKTWFHPGVEVEGGAITEIFRDEYDDFDAGAAALDEPSPPPGLDADGRAEAIRALQGRVLRTEVFGRDGTLASGRPFSVSEHAYAFVDAAHKKGTKHHHSLYVIEEQSLGYTYERSDEPDPRLVQQAVLEVDAYGNVLKTVSVAYPRRKAVPEPSGTAEDEPAPPGPAPPPRPKAVRARVIGFTFAEAKSFILPAERPGLQALAKLCEEHPGATLLVVGHTDKVGHVENNDVLSLARARSVAAYLRDDVDGWLRNYDDPNPYLRWGAAEDKAMLGALGYSPNVIGVSDFQDRHALPVTGDLDEVGRRALIGEYMALEGTVLPQDVTPIVVGGGEHYPEVPAGEWDDVPHNRRTELFLFDEGLDPPAPGDLLGPDAPAYAAWVEQVEQTVDINTDEAGVEDGRPELGGGDAPQDHATGLVPDDPQLRTEIALTQSTVVNRDDDEVYIVGAPVRAQGWVVAGERGDPRAPLAIGQLRELQGTHPRGDVKTYY